MTREELIEKLSSAVSLSQYEGYSAEIHEIYPNEFDMNQNIFAFT